MTFLRLSDAHMHQSLHRQLPSMHTCVCVFVFLYVCFFSMMRVVQTDSRGHFGLQSYNSLRVLACTVFAEMAQQTLNA